MAIRIVHSTEMLTAEYLTAKGFINDDGWYVESDLKDENKIWVKFDEHGHATIWHGKEKTFITNESTLEWFEIHYLLAHRDNGIWELAGV